MEQEDKYIDRRLDEGASEEEVVAEIVKRYDTPLPYARQIVAAHAGTLGTQVTIVNP